MSLDAAATLSLEIKTDTAVASLKTLSAEYTLLHANAAKGIAVPGIGKVESELKDLKTTVAAAVGALDALTKRGGSGGDSSGFMAGYSQSFAGFSTSLKLMVSDTEKGVDTVRKQVQSLGEITRTLANQQITWGFKIDRNFAGEVTAEAKKAFEASVQYDRAWEEAHATNLSKMLALQRAHDESVSASKVRSSVERIRLIEQAAEQERAAIIASRLKSSVELVRIQEQEAEAVRASQVRSSVEKIRLTEQLAEQERAAVIASQLRSTVELVRIKEQEAEAVRASQVRSSVERIRVEEQVAEQARAQAIRDAETQLALERKFILASQEQRIKAAIEARKLMDANYAGNMTTQFAPQTLSLASSTNLPALNAQLKQAEAAHKAATDAANKHTAATQGFGKAADEAHAFARGLSGSLGTLWMTYGSMIPLIAGAAIAGSMKSIYTTGKDLEYQFTMVSAISGGAVVNIEKFNEAVKGTMFTPMEAAKGLRVLAQAGLSVDEALNALPPVLKLATVGETDMGTAALASTAIMHAFGLEVSDFGHIGDVFSKAAAISATSVTEMMSAMKQATLVGNMYGVSLEEAGAALATLANRGIEGSAAGTALTNMVREMANPATAKAAEAMKQFGIESTHADGTAKSLLENLEQLSIVASTMSDGARSRWLEDMFNARGVKAANILLSDMTKMKQTVEDLKRSSEGLGFMNEASIKLSLSTEGMAKTLQSDMQRVLGSVFEEVQPQIKAFLGDLSNAVNSVKFKEFLEGTARALVSFTSVIVDHIGAIENMVMAYAAFKGFAMLEAGVSGAISAFTRLRAAAVGTAAVAATATTAATAATTEVGGLAATVGLISAPALAASAAIVTIGVAAYKVYDAFWGMSDAQTRAAETSKAYAVANQSLATEIDRGEEALEKEHIALSEQIRLMQEGASEADAYAASLQKVPLALADKNIAEALTASQKADQKAEAARNTLEGTSLFSLKYNTIASEAAQAQNLADKAAEAWVDATKARHKIIEGIENSASMARAVAQDKEVLRELSVAKSLNAQLTKIRVDGMVAEEALANGVSNAGAARALQAQVAMKDAAAEFKPLSEGIRGEARASAAEVALLTAQINSLKDNSYGLGGEGGRTGSRKATQDYYTAQQKKELDDLKRNQQEKLISETEYQQRVAAINEEADAKRLAARKAQSDVYAQADLKDSEGKVVTLKQLGDRQLTIENDLLMERRKQSMSNSDYEIALLQDKYRIDLASIANSAVQSEAKAMLDRKLAEDTNAVYAKYANDRMSYGAQIVEESAKQNATLLSNEQQTASSVEAAWAKANAEKLRDQAAASSFSDESDRAAAGGAILSNSSGEYLGVSSWTKDGKYIGKYANGGSFIVGGYGGTDSQRVSFMASPDERVTIETPEQVRAAQNIRNTTNTTSNTNNVTTNTVAPNVTVNVNVSNGNPKDIVSYLQREFRTNPNLLTAGLARQG